MNIDLGQPISYGRTAEIYPWNQGEVLKLFYDWFKLENIEKEAWITQAVHSSGLSAPAVGEIIRVNNRYGLLYERVNGVSMTEAVYRKPWKVFRYAQRMAQLHTELHASTLPVNLPSQREKLEKEIYDAEALPAQLRFKVLAALKIMPDGDQLCHGDFWPGNIMMTEQGEIIIDWIHASRGNPLADLARTTNLALGLIETSQIQKSFLSLGWKKTSRIKKRLFQIFCRFIYPIYPKYYFKIRPGGEDEYQHWLPIVAAARLSDSISELEKMLITQVESNL